MYEGNIDIDKPRDTWYIPEVEKLFIFCLLDRAMQYEEVCKVYRGMDYRGLTSFSNLRERSFEYIRDTLKQFGHRFYNQTAEFIKHNVDKYNALDLYEFTRNELVKNIRGFSYKLASMFHNRLHGTSYAIIDVHVDRFLERLGLECKSYLEKEKKLMIIARTLGMTMEELDWKIWSINRIGNNR